MDRSKPSIYYAIGFILLAVALASILAPIRLTAIFRDLLRSTAKVRSHTTINMTMARTPVYFFSHGGPNIMYDQKHPVFSKLQNIGREITQIVKPKAVVVFSAHWQGEPDVIEVNTSENTDLIYDFYGFPEHYYKEKFPNKGSPQLASEIIELLGQAGIKSQGMRRGPDHGVWASFKVAFNPDTNPLNVPIVQVSLFDSDSPEKHFALGRAVSSLRSRGVQIIVSGMSVHNLRDMRFGSMSKPMPYTTSFDQALKDAVEGDVQGREERMAALLQRKDAKQAHPSFEHLLPIFVGAGAADGDEGVRLWTKEEGSLAWALYRFGKVDETAAKSEL